VLVIDTVPDGYNSGSSYHLAHIESTGHGHASPEGSQHSLEPGRTSSAESCIERLQSTASSTDAHSEQVEMWISQIRQEMAEAKRRHATKARLLRAQQGLRAMYNTNVFQFLIALLILANFVLTAYQLQVHPQPGTELEEQFERGDMLFTYIFAVELLLNYLAHVGLGFWEDGWNQFDVVVVTICLISLLNSSLDSIKSLRLVRPFRVLRVFARLASLRMLVNAISASILPVANALVIVMIVIAIYAVLGVSFFMDFDPNFATFGQAMFTMFQVATVDEWGNIARTHTEPCPDGNLGCADLGEGTLRLTSALYFMSFILIVSFTLLPVVVAVLLDNFTVATRKEKDKQLMKRHEERNSQQVT